MSCRGSRLLATVAKQQSHGSLSDFAWIHIATIFPCESTRSCRLLHMTSRAEKAANDYKTKQVKNLEFVKRWNIENGALYGPKLRGHKKLAKQNKGVLLMSNDEIPISLNEPAFFEIPMPTEQRKDTTELKVSNTPKVKPVPKPKAGPKPDSVPRPALFVSGDTNELDWILKFPMFSSGKDALLQMMPGSPSEQLSSVSALEGQPVARVSRILEDTKSDHSKFMLARWLTKMVEEMGKEEFAKFQSGKMRNASNLHGCIEQYLLGTPENLLNLTEANQPFWGSLQTVFSNLGDIHSVEVKTKHPVLHYTGVHDCIGVFKNELCLIDWKTSSKPKPSIGDLYDYPLQTAAYLGAVNHDPGNNTQVENMLIVVAYEDGSAAHAHFIPRQQTIQFWGQWCQRLHKYWCQKLVPTQDGRADQQPEL